MQINPQNQNRPRYFVPSQADFEKVTTLVVRPVERHYNKTFTPDEIDDYVKSLARYSEETLIEAMLDVRENEVRRPALAHIVQAAKRAIGKGEIAATQRNGGNSGDYAKILDERHMRLTRAEQAAKDYSQRFCAENGPRLAALAPHDRTALTACVYQAARFQAAFLEGLSSVGYRTAEWLGKENAEERIGWWLEMNRTAIKEGWVGVQVPWLWFERPATPPNAIGGG
jgi:hypothetical protein